MTKEKKQVYPLCEICGDEIFPDEERFVHPETQVCICMGCIIKHTVDYYEVEESE